MPTTLPPAPAAHDVQDGATAAPALALRNVTRVFGAHTALDGVDLEIAGGEVHCVLGENGAGKSTLCNIVFGSMPPTSGQVLLGGERFAPASPADALARGVAMVHQHFSLVPTLTVEENMLLGRGVRRLRPDRAGLAARLAAIAETLGLRVDLDARAEDLSVGARQRVEIVKALLDDPRILLLDEPTAVLGPEEVDSLLATCRRVAAAGTAVVLVTHKLGEVMRVGDRATVLRGGRVAGSGPLARDDAPDRPGGLGAADLVGLMVGRDASSLDPVLAASVGVVGQGPAPQGRQEAARTADRTVAQTSVRDTTDGRDAGTPPVLVVSGLCVDDADGARRVDDVDLAVRPGEIVGIAGVEGNGQSELVAALSGALRPSRGTVRLGGTDITGAGPRRRTALGLGVVPEDRHHEGVVTGLSVTTNLLLGRLRRFRRFGLLDRRAMQASAADLARRFDVRTASLDAPVSSLSGGNQQKAVLARELSLDPLRCVVAAQPTRGLDLGAVDDVVGHLRAAASAGVGVLVVSSELSELLVLCDRVHVAYRGGLRGPVPTDAPDARDRVAHLMTGAAA
ncbi:nucleoside ABC transporter ATP-binding protein [Isoptericola sp. CG 20/1183]|uniref:Nucleoside ABC transporter ATP-binding protein n=1 Tax=Isoptericola halotolerans TaxID=300560 RepID=A0ABX5ELM8_9MICO|nr:MULTISPECIES: ABC transporter ATP-binding protein [Isoptericola]PRZ09638.1 nucleoside ABC transporter ATP-binding protein [Isoptericola sp. CG 20/1183]PRZ10439.1 nucleoside ABC transporter ATP-binding protein [Isoptericola halotolerans]